MRVEAANVARSTASRTLDVVTETAAPRPLRVLVVDDDDEFARLLRTRLEARGHVVAHAPSAFGVVNAVAGRGDDRPDVVVLDVMLPGLSGAAALELLAKDPRTRDTPVVVVTAVSALAPHALVEAHGRASFRAKDGRFGALAEYVEERGRAA